MGIPLEISEIIIKIKDVEVPKFTILTGKNPPS